MNELVIAGVAVRCDVAGRYSLNDLHRASGGDKKHQPSNFTALKQTQDLVAEISTAPEITGAVPLVVIAGGTGQGTYVCRELVYAYVMWISPKFHLQVIRTFDAVVSSTPINQNVYNVKSDTMQAGLLAIDFMQKSLNVNLATVRQMQQGLKNSGQSPIPVCNMGKM